MSDLLQMDSNLFEENSPPSMVSCEGCLIDGDLQIDLANYISNYDGYIYYQRLFFIAQRCPSLRYTAIRLAHDYIKNHTLDTSSYNKIFLILAEEFVSTSSSVSGEAIDDQTNSAFRSNLYGLDVGINGSGEFNTLGSTLSDSAKTVLTDIMSGRNVDNLVYDYKWEESTRRKALTLLEQLDTELKNHKANSLKENIRRGSDDLGDLYLRLGQLTNAIKCYSRSRDYCTSQQQELIMCLNVIKVAIFQRAWSHVGAHITRASNLSELRETTAFNNSSVGVGFQSKTSSEVSRLGLSESGFHNTAPRSLNENLHGGSDGSSTLSGTGQNYRDALAYARTQLAIAAGLMQLSVRNYRGAAMNFLQVNPDHCDCPTSRIVSISDLAFFITLCCLATFDRSELATLVLGSSTLRMLLETEPVCRDMIQSFHQADYVLCLGRLRKIKNFLRLDIFLADHVTALCREIRSRALCQYFSPYSSADLNRMARAFDTTVPDLENELFSLIQDGSIKARIDSHEQVLRALDVDQRCLTFARSLQLVEEYKNRTHTVILRLALTRQKISVKSVRDDSDAAFHYLS